jgi:hypothetical protein
MSTLVMNKVRVGSPRKATVRQWVGKAVAPAFKSCTTLVFQSGESTVQMFCIPMDRQSFFQFRALLTTDHFGDKDVTRSRKLQTIPHPAVASGKN